MKGLDGEDRNHLKKKTKDLDRYFYRELRVNVVNYHERGMESEEEGKGKNGTE